MGIKVGASLQHFAERYKGRRVPQARCLSLGPGVAVRLLRLGMPTGLKRYYGKGHLHFITFSCYRRLPLLKTAHARDLFVKELAKVRDELGFQLVGYVVMPEHVHLLVSEPKTGTPSTVLQKLKQRVARKLRKPGPTSAGQMSSSFEGHEEPLRAFWQARFYDFNVYKNGKKKEKLNYMHANPVTRGLVKHPKDWQWSSWSSYYGGAVASVRIDAEA
jgi:REP-associated tyrosine transposase